MIESLTGQGINVQQACVLLAVSQSGYYAWRGRVDAPRTLRRIWLAGEIADVHKASGGTYGALRVTAELHYGRDIQVGHNAVELIMRELGIKGLPTRRLPRGAKVSKVTSLDLVRRVFRRDRPNELWLTDIEPSTRPVRERSTARWCSTHSRGSWSGGRSTARRPPRSCSTRWGWPPSAARTATGS